MASGITRWACTQRNQRLSALSLLLNTSPFQSIAVREFIRSKNELGP